MSKQYGLILPKKTKDHPIQPVSKSHSIFNEDSDSDTPKPAKPTGSSITKKQDTLNQQKAIDEDPTVYQYDEIYDEMEQQRKETKLAKKDKERKPKYINKLLAAAEKRKRENERRIERQVQKEREEEGDKYKDKESFVTSSYKKKLEEMKKLEEEEKREEYLESIGDVRKQGNLDGFYRHLYDQKVNYEDNTLTVKTEIKEEPTSGNEEQIIEPAQTVNASPGSSQSLGVNGKRKTIDTDSNDGHLQKKRSRNYRARQESDESDKEEGKEIKLEHLPSNIDADSDFSIDSSDSEEESTKETKSDTKEEMVKTIIAEEETPINTIIAEEEKIVKEETKKDDTPKIKKPKVDIWKKRTVGEKFDEAVKRYFERKAQREMGL